MFSLLSPALVADYQAGLDAYLAGDFDTAISEWQTVVESPQGTVPDAVRAETLYAIGMLFWTGQGVQQDTIEAASWLNLAARMGHPGAQNKMAFLYSSGQGVMQSDFKALKWWQLAANQGDADAQYNLGVAFRDGLGVEPDPEKSMMWFREAAANGDPVSAGIIAEFEMTPESEPPAEVTASIWDEDWLRERAPDRYTIQVIALRQLDKLKAYIAKHEALAPFAIFGQTRYQNPIWVLVQGDYPDVESARRAVQDFPEDMQQRDKLWIRRFEMVQRLLE
jgi:septal ring-binding cell division protein DamX